MRKMGQCCVFRIFDFAQVPVCIELSGVQEEKLQRLILLLVKRNVLSD